MRPCALQDYHVNVQPSSRRKQSSSASAAATSPSRRTSSQLSTPRTVSSALRSTSRTQSRCRTTTRSGHTPRSSSRRTALATPKARWTSRPMCSWSILTGWPRGSRSSTALTSRRDIRAGSIGLSQDRQSWVWIDDEASSIVYEMTLIVKIVSWRAKQMHNAAESHP